MKATSIYRRILQCYPAEFRGQYAAEMLRDFESDWQSARRRGSASVRRYLIHLGWDFCRTLPKEIYRVAPRAWMLFAAIAAVDVLYGISHPAFGLLALVYLAWLPVARLASRLDVVACLVAILAGGAAGYGATRLIATQVQADALVFTAARTDWVTLVVSAFLVTAFAWQYIVFTAMMDRHSGVSFWEARHTPAQRIARAFLNKGHAALLLGWAVTGFAMTLAGARSGGTVAAAMVSVPLLVARPLYRWCWDGLPIPAGFARLVGR